MKRCIKMKSENNILKTYLQNAIALAQSRKICIFGYQTPALVTYAGLLALNADIDCFLDFEKGRVNTILFNKQVKDVYSYLATEKDNCFIKRFHCLFAVRKPKGPYSVKPANQLCRGFCPEYRIDKSNRIR